MAYNDHFLDEFYVEDVDYDHPGYSHVPSGHLQPPSVRSDDFDRYSDCFAEVLEVGDSPVSPLALGHEVEGLLLRYWGELYHVNAESSGADSLSGGRSAAHSGLFYSKDACLSNDPGINLPPFSHQILKAWMHRLALLDRLRQELMSLFGSKRKIRFVSFLPSH